MFLLLPVLLTDDQARKVASAILRETKPKPRKKRRSKK